MCQQPICLFVRDTRHSRGLLCISCVCFFFVVVESLIFSDVLGATRSGESGGTPSVCLFVLVLLSKRSAVKQSSSGGPTRKNTTTSSLGREARARLPSQEKRRRQPARDRCATRGPNQEKKRPTNVIREWPWRPRRSDDSFGSLLGAPFRGADWPDHPVGNRADGPSSVDGGGRDKTR